MKLDKKVIIGIIVLIIAAIVIYKYMHKPPTNNTQENFVVAGSLDSIGVGIPDGRIGNFELVPEVPGGIYPSLDSTLAAVDFADLVDSGDQAFQVATVEAARRPLERLQNLSDSYFPTIASKALPFSQEAAKPLTFHHAVNLPRVNLKGKLYNLDLATAVRGTLPINYDPNVPLISASQFNNSDVFAPGLFTPAFNSLHNKLTGGYKNMPMYIAGAAAATPGCAGVGIEAIMDI
jgi:hypothetical protein